MPVVRVRAACSSTSMRSWSCSGSVPGATGSATTGGRQFGGGGLVGGGAAYSLAAAFAEHFSLLAAAPGGADGAVCAGLAQAASSGRARDGGRTGVGSGAA